MSARTETDLIKWKLDNYKKEHPQPPLPPRIAGLDPGRQRDSFAMVGIEVRDRKDIHITGAAEWKYSEYSSVEEQVRIISQTIVKRPFNYIVVETNNAGWHVVETLRKMSLPILAVNTTGKVTDPRKLRDGKSMPKNDTVEWLRRVVQDTKLGREDRPNIFFPKNHSKGTLALWNQMPKMTRKITDAGNVSYAAQGQEHDDLVMALVLASHVARIRYIQKPTGPVGVVTGSYKKKPNQIKRAEDWFPEIGGFNQLKSYTVTGPR